MNRKLLALLAVPALCVSTIGAAQSCSPATGKPGAGQTAAYAGDGITRFGDTGKLKWGVSYSAHYIDTTDRQNCRWSLYTQTTDGTTTPIARGNYFTAKIRVGRQVTKQVYLKSAECGLWKPK